MNKQVVVLGQHHEVTTFDCGNEKLNTWLRAVARQHQAKSLSRTYVLEASENPGAILGFYSLNMRSGVLVDDLPPDMAKKLPTSIPALTIGRFGVDVTAQRQGCGEQLLVDAMHRAKQVAQQIGGVFLFVDAKDGDVADFYRHYGFRPTPSDELILFIKIADIP